MGCHEDADCNSGFLVRRSCNTDTNRCGPRKAIECTSDDKCRRRIGSKGFCYNNFCFRSCASNKGCPGRYYNVCDKDNSRCVMCNVDDDCDGGVCNTRQGRCVECNVNDDCDRGVCDEERGKCMECKVDDDCAKNGPNSIYTLGRKFCGFRVTVTDAGYYSRDGKCVECRSHSHCKAGDVCNWNYYSENENGKCYTLGQGYCTSDDHCRPTPGSSKKGVCHEMYNVCLNPSQQYGYAAQGQE